MKTIKGKGRKLLAAALSLLMLVGLLPVSAFAAGSSVTVTFAYLYQSDGSQIMYQDTFVGTHAVNGGAGHPAVQIYADGEEAYCIEPGEHLLTGDVLTENASEAWNSLGSAKQEAIKMALAFGKPGNAGGLIGSGDAKHLATQMIVWEFVCGYRDAASYALLDNCIYNAFCKNGANAEVAASYNAIAQATFGFKELERFKADNYLKAAEMSMEDDYGMIDGIINNGPKKTTAEIEAEAMSGKPVSLRSYVEAVHREQETQKEEPRKEKKPSVLAKLHAPISEPKKTARSKSAEREL